MKNIAILAGLLVLPILCSCETPQVQVGRLVDPIVTEVSTDGRSAKVGMGAFDGLHGGQRLYVARSNKLVGVLTVRTLDTYSAECNVVASKDVTPEEAAGQLAAIRPGDMVHRSILGLERPAMKGEKVQRMVPVPYEAQEKPVDTTGNADPSKPAQKDIQPPVIPRDQIDEWMKTHPRKTN